MWKRSSLVLCIAALTIASIFAGAGTYAYHSGETFTLNFFSPEDIEPVISGLNPGETDHIIIKFPNNNNFRIKAKLRLLNVECEENNIMEPEQNWYDLNSVRNDIDSAITFGLWIDRDGDTDNCDTVAGDEWIIDEADDSHIDDVENIYHSLGTIEPGETLTIVTSYHMDEETENWAQSDKMTFDIEITREQVITTFASFYAPPKTPSIVIVDVPANQTGYVVDASEIADTTVTLDTIESVTVTITKYKNNPHPGDPLPPTALPIYADISISDHDAVIWPIYVEMFYTDEDVEGLDEASMGIYYWMDDAWHRCSDTGVYMDRNIAWAYMTSYEASGSPIMIGGMPTIPVPPLPPFLDNLNITPAEIELGDNVTISFDIRNMDSQHITYMVDIQIGYLTFPVDVELEAYEFKTMSRTMFPTAVGIYNVTVIGMTGNFTVKAAPLPAEFVVSDLTITPEEADIREEVEISFTVTNIGELPGDYSFTIGIEGPLLVVSKEMTGSLEAGESEVSSYELMEDVPGTYRVEVDGLKDSFEVKAPPSAGFVLSDLTITPEEIELGDEVTVSFVIRNADSRSFVFVPFVQIGDTMIMEGVELEGHESRTVSHTMIPESVGDYDVEVDGLEGSFTVTPIPTVPIWMRPGTIAGIIIIIVAISVVLYAAWKGKLPSLSPKIDDEI